MMMITFRVHSLNERASDYDNDYALLHINVPGLQHIISWLQLTLSIRFFAVSSVLISVGSCERVLRCLVGATESNLVRKNLSVGTGSTCSRLATPPAPQYIPWVRVQQPRSRTWVSRLQVRCFITMLMLHFQTIAIDPREV